MPTSNVKGCGFHYILAEYFLSFFLFLFEILFIYQRDERETGIDKQGGAAGRGRSRVPAPAKQGARCRT